MNDQSLPILKQQSTNPLTRGHEHGEIFKEQIKELCEIRLELMLSHSQFQKSSEALELANNHIAPLKDYSSHLYLELKGISEASNVSLNHLIILNNYTDLRDINIKTPHTYEAGCTIIYAPTKNGPILAQTWDIHQSALPFTMLLENDDSLVFSVTGCLGMMGVNKYGVGIGINNLSSLNAKVGVMWPAVVRKSLTFQTAYDAKEAIMKTAIGSGRHYAIGDEHTLYGIEVSSSHKKLITENHNTAYFHTNHCIDEDMKAHHHITKESTSVWRFDYLAENLRHEELKSAQDVFFALKEVSLPLDEYNKHKSATCGTVAIDIKNRSMIACKGIANKELIDGHNSKYFFKPF